MADYCDSLLLFIGEIELNERYFGVHRVQDKRGRGAYGKIILFGLPKPFSTKNCYVFGGFSIVNLRLNFLSV